MATFVSFWVESNANQCDTNLIFQGNAKYWLASLIRVRYVTTNLCISFTRQCKEVNNKTKGIWSDIVRD